MTNKTHKTLTTETVTIEQIEQLGRESAVAGDDDMGRVAADAAKAIRNGRFEAGEVADVEACVEAINAARAMES